MGGTEIILILLGVLFVVGSFFIKDKLSNKDLDTITNLTEKELKIIVDKQLKTADSKVADYVDEAIDRCSEKTKREIEKTTNEKIMAINEYSDTVLDAINNSHNEVMFLYSMLNDKHTELTGLCGQLQRYSSNLQNTVAEYEKEPVIMETRNLVVEQVVEEEVPVTETTVEQEIDTPENNHNQSILKRHEMGYSDVEIAKELNLGIGEVRLVIGLYKGEV